MNEEFAERRWARFSAGGQDWCDQMNVDADLSDLADEMTELNPNLGARIRELVNG